MKKFLTLASLLCMSAISMAQVTFTCTGGKNFGTNEGMDKLFDGNLNTKYCQNAGSDCYALVTASEPVYVWGYDMTTANDNENYGRLVTQWTLYGTNDESVANNPDAQGWVKLSDLGENTWVQKKNFYKQRFFCDKGTAGTAYKYFKLTFDKGGFIQVSEFSFCYSKTRIVEYNWYKSSDENSKKAFDGKPNPKWEGNNLAGNWIIIETADQKAHPVRSYSFTTNDDGSWNNRAPKEWTLEGCIEADGDDVDNWVWETIDDVKGGDPINNENFKTFEFVPSNISGEYRYVRLTLKSMKSTNWTQIGEFHVVTDASSTSDYYTSLVNEAKAKAFERGSLSESDPWYVEYKTLYDGLDATLSAAIVNRSYNTLQANLDEINALLPLMEKMKASATGYVAFDGSSCWGDGHYSQLVDGKDGIGNNAGSKWGGNFSGEVGAAEHVQYVIFRRGEALQPFFYKLVTGGDTKTQTVRNWKTWKVFGANFASLSEAVPDSSKWVKLDERVNISSEYLPMENCYPATFDFNKGVNEPYYYFMVQVLESNGSSQQMNEMYLCTKEEFETQRAPLVAYFDDFNVAELVIETSKEGKKAEFATLFAELQTTADAVRLTKVYNELVALRAELEGSAAYMTLVNTTGAAEGDTNFELGTANQMVAFANASRRGYNNLSAALTEDIDLKDVTMAPIGTQDYPYKGTFDGQGHAVTNYTYNHSDENNVGLFGIISGATIQKVMLKGASINGNANAGGLVGNAQGASVIKNCAVVDSDIEGKDHVAAIAANAIEGTVISNNYSNATVKSRNYQAGGMVGTIMLATIEKNLFTGSVTCENNGDASGLVSRIDGVATSKPVIRNNMVAASKITGGTTFAIIRANWSDRPVTFADNYTLMSTEYSTGEKSSTDKDSADGKQVSDRDATCKSFYAETLGWDMVNDWKFVAAGQFPVLAWMEASAAAPQTITVTAAGYATAVAKNELDFTNSDANAYIAQVVDNKYVHLEPITIVPAGEPFIVKAAAGSYQIPAAVENGDATGNDLKASDTDIAANGSQYVLAQPEGQEVGFYQAVTGTIAAGKAFIALDGTGPLVKALYFEGEDATGINGLNDVNGLNDAVIYNVAGQKLSKLQKGINIVGGKKVLK